MEGAGALSESAALPVHGISMFFPTGNMASLQTGGPTRRGQGPQERQKEITTQVYGPFFHQGSIDPDRFFECDRSVTWSMRKNQKVSSNRDQDRDGNFFGRYGSGRSNPGGEPPGFFRFTLR